MPIDRHRAHPGRGSLYAYLKHDIKGDVLDGSNNYRLRIPPGVPAKDFWSGRLRPADPLRIADIPAVPQQEQSA